MTDFTNTEYVRVYRTYDGWEDLSIEARCLFLLLTREFDHEGYPDESPWLVAAGLQSSGMPVIELIDAGFLEEVDEGFRCPWWAESQMAKKSTKQRVREHRTKRGRR